MDLIEVKRFAEELITAYQKAENYNILVSSSDKVRCFKLLEKNVNEYRDRLAKLLVDGGSDNIASSGDGAREKSIRGELL
jgi:hypothetical protein